MLSSKKHINIGFIILILLAASLPYLNSITNGFVWDDVDLIKNNPEIREISKLPEMFISPFGNPVQYAKNLLFYRPVVFASYMIDYKIYGLNPAGYHFSNLLFHIASSLLVFFIFVKIFSNLRLALLSSILFAVHPVHTESVSWISGRTDLLCALFFLLSLNSYLNSSNAKGRSFYCSYLLSILFFSLSIFSKEMGIMLPLIIFSLELFFLSDIDFGIARIRYCFKRSLPFLFPVALYLLLRTVALKGDIYHSSAGDTLFQRILPMFGTFFDYSSLLIFPFNLNTLYLVKMPSSFFDAEILLSLLFILLIVLSILKLKQNRREYVFGILWFFVTLFPVSNIIPFSTIVKAEHFLYLPSVGFTVSLSAILLICANKLNIGKIVYIILAVAIVMSLSVLTYQRNFVWKNEITLFNDQVLKSPLSAIAHNNLGLAYKSDNRLGSAKKEFITAKNLALKIPESYINLGNVFLNEGNLESAMKEYMEAMKINPRDAYVHNNLGVCYGKSGDFKEAIAEFKKASLFNPLYQSPYINAGNAYVKLKQFDKAEESLKKALSIDSYADNSAHFLLGVVYRYLGEGDKAIAEFKKALKVNGQNSRTLLQLAESYVTSGGFDEAYDYYNSALELDPGNLDLKNKIDSLRKKLIEKSR